MAITAAQLDIIFTSKGADKAKRDIDDVGGSVSRAGSGFDKLKAGALGLGTALIAPMGLGLKSAVALEQSIANVNAALGGVDSSTLDSLTTSFQDIGTASQYSAIEVANVGEELIKAGFGVEDLLGGMTQSVVDLAQATGDGLGPAMDGVVQIMSTWKTGIVDSSIAMTDASRVADILTVAANESKAGLTDIQAGMRSLAPVAAMMGIPVEDAAAAIALFTNNGLRGADAGISLARGLQNLADPTSEAATRMDELGIAAFDANGTFVGFPSLFRQLQTGMAGLDDQTKFTALSTIFGAEAMDVMGLAIMNGADPLEAMIALMGESGAAAEQSALRMDTLGAQFDTLVEGVTTFLGSLVQGLIPGLRWLVDGANAVVDVLMLIPKPIKTIVGAVAGLLAAFAAANVAIKGFAAFNMLTGGTGLGLSLGRMIPLVRAITLGAGLAYVAYRKNFLGIGKIVDKTVDGITGFIDNLTEAWDDLGKVTNAGVAGTEGWNAEAASGAKYSNKFARGLGALSTAMLKALNINSPQWIKSLALGFDDAARFVQNFTDKWNELGRAIGVVDDDMSQSERVHRNFFGAVTGDDMGAGGNAARIDAVSRTLLSLSAAVKGITGDDTSGWLVSLAFGFDRLAASVQEGGWVGLLDQVGRELMRFAGWAAGQVLDLAIDVAVRIGSWLFSAAVDFASSLRTWVFGGVGDTGIEIPNIAVRVGNWIKGSGFGDLWQKIKVWAMGGVAGDGTGGATGPGGANQEISIGEVGVRILGWLIRPFESIWTAIQNWAGGGGKAGELVRQAEGQEVTIGDVAVKIGSWAFSAVTDLWTAVSNWVTGSGGAGVGDSLMSESGGASTSTGRGPIELGTVAIKIGDFDITIDFAGMWSAIESQFKAGTTVTPAMVASASERGREIGEQIWTSLSDGLSSFFSGGGGGGDSLMSESGDGNLTGSSGLSAMVTSFIGGALEGIGTGINDSITSWLNEQGEEIQTSISEWWDGLWDVDLSIPDFDITSYLPDISFSVEDIPGYAAAKSAVEEIGRLITNPIGWYRDNVGDQGGSPRQNNYAGMGAKPTPISGGQATTQGGQAVTSLPSTGAGPQVVKIEADNSAAMRAIGDVSAGIAGLSAMSSAVTITADNAMAMQAIGSVSKGLAGLTAMTASVTLTADNAAAMQAIGTVSKGMAGIDSMTSTVILVGDNAAAMQSIGDVSAGMYGIDGMTSTIFVEGDNGGAMGAINEIAAYDGVIIATSYVDIVARQIGSGAAIGNSIIAGTRGALGIHSPSTEFADIAKWTARGFQKGWEREFSNPNIGPTVAALPPVSGYAYSASASADTGGSGTFAPVINNYIDATGKDIDEEKLADLAAVKTMTAVQVALERHERAMGGR